MIKKLRILVTGFGPFPGAPFNPTVPLVKRLARLRRPALSDVTITTHIFDVAYAMVDLELPQLLATHRPHALLMFGFAALTPWLRIETRARNAVTTIWPDQRGARDRKGSITGMANARAFGPHVFRLLRAARLTGIDARASRDAGSYVCNFLCWRAIEATDARHDPEKWEPVFGQDHAETEHAPRIAAFIHIPSLRRDGSARVPGGMTLEHLADAGEAILLELVKGVRQAGLAHSRNSRPPRVR